MTMPVEPFPFHVISGDPDLIEPFVAWGFARGALPDPDQPARRMDVFRDWFVHAFQSTSHTGRAALDVKPIDVERVT